MVVVYCDGCFDLFHYGHVNFLKKAKSYGDKLIVGVHSDETIKRYKRSPIMSMDERIKVIEACKYVDCVVKDAPLCTSANYFKKHNVDIIISSMYWSPEILKKYYTDAIEKVIRIPYTEEISTSEIINRIKNF